MKTIFNSDGMSLHFPDVALSIAYEWDQKMLYLKHYILIRNKYGIWANNQNKFVETVQDLRPMDSREMEILLSRYSDVYEIKPYRGIVKLNGSL